jgi:RNA polymerase sigma-70 factor (ECF subfamily)
MIKPVERHHQPLAIENFRSFLTRTAQRQLAAKGHWPLEVSDIVQSSLLEAFRQQSGFQGRSESELAGWLKSVLKHNIADAIRGTRRAKRDVRRQRSLDVLRGQFGGGCEFCPERMSVGPGQQLEREEAIDTLRAAVADLPTDQCRAVTLHHLDGLSLREVARLMDKSEPAVAGLLFRGLRQLRKTLQSESER